MGAGPPLTPDQQGRYSRHLLLPEIGETGQRRLLSSRVLVIGAGGLGSPILSYLVAAGVGHITVIDDDVVEASNLQRQTIFTVGDVGRPKVRAALERLRGLNPDVDLVGRHERLTADNADEVFAGHHVVLDGSDNFATRYLVADACERVRVPEVFGSVLRFDASVAVFWPGRGPTYRDVFAEPPAAGAVPSCAQAGVLGAICGIIGSVMAAEAVKLLIGAGAPLIGRLLVLDALAMTWRTVPLASTVPTADGRAAPPARLGDARVDPRRVGDLVASGVQLLDVRTRAEADLVQIPGSVLIEVDDLLQEAPGGTAGEPLDYARPVLVYCHSGARSARAAEYLRANGFADVRELAGGVVAWVELVRPELSEALAAR